MMNNGPVRQRWLRIVSLVVLVILALSWVPNRALAWAPASPVQIISKAGAVMGTATFTPTAFGQTQIELRVRGFDPVGGDRALVITQVGFCAPPDFRRFTGAVVVNLPSVQFFPDGSAEYRRTVTIPAGALNSTDGSALLLLADTHLGSDVIACGVIVPTSRPPVAFPPAPTPPPPAPPPPAHICPATPPAVATTTVVAPVGLKLRTGAGLTRAVILTLRNGETVFPISDLVANQGISWVRLRVFRAGVCFEGWASAAFLARWASVAPPVAGERRVTASAGLRLRSGPGTSFAVLRIVPLGTRLGFTGGEQSADGIVWVRVRVDGREFWAARNFVERIS
jgi:uncharacterized protein YgiM (DUF1202 family)